MMRLRDHNLSLKQQLLVLCSGVQTDRINIRVDPARQPVKAVCTPSFKANYAPHPH